MQDYWPVSDQMRAGVVTRVTSHAANASDPRHAVAGFRLLVTASMQNLRNRQLDHDPGPAPLLPVATRAEYDAWCHGQPEYLAYLHDFDLFRRGYPPGEKLQYLEFEVRPFMGQSVCDESKDKEPWRRYQRPQPPQLTWEEADLWHIPT